MSVNRTSRWFAAVALGCLVASPTQAAKIMILKEATQPPLGEKVSFAPVNVERLKALGAKVVADYPTRLLVEVPDVAAKAFTDQAKAEGLSAIEQASYDRIRVNGYDFDSRGELPKLPADMYLSDYHGSTGLYLLQFVGPPLKEWVEAVNEVGVLLEYLPDNAYILRANPADVEGLRKAQYIQHLSVYQPAYKLRADVAEADEPFQAIVQLDGGQDLGDVGAILDGVARSEVVFEKSGPVRNASLALTAVEAKALASLPEVLWIERNLDVAPSDERQAQAISGVHDAVKPTTPTGYSSALASHGFCTATVRTNCIDYWTKVAVFDTGLDDNWCNSSPSSGTDCIASDNAYQPDRHPDFGKYSGGTREKQFFCVGPATGNNYCKGYNGAGTRWNYSDTHYHGTAVASVIAGDPLTSGGVESITNARDRYDSGYGAGSGFYLGTGIAQLAEIISFRIFNKEGNSFLSGQPSPAYYYTPTDWERWYGQLPAYPTTRFANNSWNMSHTPSCGDNDTNYTTHSQKFDQLVRDADGGYDDSSHPMTIVFSAGNANSCNPGNYVMSPANAKNVLTVGASASWRPYDIAPWYPGRCLQAATIANIASFSVRGVAGDPNRFKPDIVAPGEWVGVAQTRAPIDASVVWYCNFPPYASDENGQYYARGEGTSFAAPAVTGLAVLADAWYYDKTGSIASPAMIKALLAAHAQSMAGGTDELNSSTLTRSPSMPQGWGRANFDGLFQTYRPVKYFDEDHRTSGEERRFTTGEGPWSVTLRRASSTDDIIVAMAFTDRYSFPGANPLMCNILTLAVYNGTYHFSENNFGVDGYTGRESAGGSYHDYHNTIKLIRIRAADLIGGETFSVVVTPQVLGKAVPGLDGATFNQDFALYVYNATNP